MFNMKKILIAGTVLTALCAHAFAAETTDQPKPPIKERVNAILSEHHGEGPAPCDDYRGPRHGGPRYHNRGPVLTPEQRQERESLREKWDKMTPEERQQAHDKFVKEYREAREKYAQETMNKLTPEQKAQVEQFIKDSHESRTKLHGHWRDMTPEQRDAVRANDRDYRDDYRRHYRDDRGYRGPHHGGYHRSYCPGYWG